MEQIERIEQMEQHLNRASQAVIQLSAAIDQYTAAQDSLKALSSYYGSNEWKKDFADDEAGRLPEGFLRGVLFEDGIWNLLAANKDLKERLQALTRKL